MLPRKLWQGIRDHIQLLSVVSEESPCPSAARIVIRDLAASVAPLGDDATSWIGALPWLEQQIQGIEGALEQDAGNSAPAKTLITPDLAWWAGETSARLRGVRNQIESLIPWALPEYLSLFHSEPIERITLASLPSAYRDVENQVAEWLNNSRSGETERGVARLLHGRLPAAFDNAAMLSQSLRRLADDADRLAGNMDFSFLYDSKRDLFSMGYNVTAGALDPFHYDLLASEARTAVFVAAAKGEVRQEAWFQLGRPFTSYMGERLLLSWSGTMFEYLMPALWMRSHPDTIIDQTLRAAVHCQQKYGRRNGVPWGISEAAFSERNPQGAYGYRAFGVPGLAIDPHGPDNLVIPPYASYLALMVEGAAAVRNLEELRMMG
jgi:cyclic beta-1,2-glucan synthetase